MTKHSPDEIKSALHNNTFVLWSDKNIKFSIYGDREWDTINLLELIRLAIETGMEANDEGMEANDD